MASHDEFRIRVQTAQPRELLKALRHASVGEGERALLGRVATTHEGDHVFLYADSEDVADAIAASVRATMAAHALTGELTVWRWHPLQESWEDAAVPMPSDEQLQRTERDRLQRSEDAESRALGYDEWEVRITLPTHADASALARRLAQEGLAPQRHWRHLILGAEDEVAARDLARRIEAELPGSDVVVEGAGMPLWEALNPYAVFGGLGH